MCWYNNTSSSSNNNDDDDEKANYRQYRNIRNIRKIHKNSAKHIASKGKNCKERPFVRVWIDSTVPFSSVYGHEGLAALGQMLNARSSAALYKYRDTAQLRDGGERKAERRYENSQINYKYPTKINSTIYMKRQWPGCSIRSAREFWSTS